MRGFRRGITAFFLLASVLAQTAAARAQGQSYIVVVKDEQRLYLAQGDPQTPRKTDVIKDFPVTTGALWTQKGLETPSGYYTIIEKSNSPVQGGYDFSDTGDVTLTPYFMRLDVPNRGGIGIHTYTGRTLDLWRFGVPGGQTTHGCIAGPAEQIIDLYKNYVRPGRTKVWIVDHASEAFKDIPAPEKPEHTEVDGKVWRAVESPTEEQFYGVDLVDADTGWAISGDATFNGDKYGWKSNIYRWDGETWTREATVPQWLHGIDMLDESEGWTVGQNFMGGLHRVDGEWVKVPPSDIETDEIYVSDVQALAPDNAWTAGGSGEIWHWNGVEFELNYSPEIMKTIRSLSMLDARTGWMVGGGWDTTTDEKATIPMIGRLDGDTWVSTESPVTELWYGVDTVAEDDAWAVGSGGAIIRWDGEEWQSVRSPTTARLSDVEMISARDGWAVGDEKGVALHWDGRTWEPVRLPVDAKFYEITVTEDGAAMAVGQGGAIIELVDAARAAAEAKPIAEPTAEPAEPQLTPETQTVPDEPYATAVAEGEQPTAEVMPTEAAPVEGAQQNPLPEATEQIEASTDEALRGSSTIASPGSVEPTAIAQSGPTTEPAQPSPESRSGGMPVGPVVGGMSVLGLLAAAGTYAARRKG